MLNLKYTWFTLFYIFLISHFGICYPNDVVKGEVQSCSGCSLRNLPEVKSFIFEDVPNYEDVTFKHVQGAPPELVLFSDNFEEVERIPLKNFRRAELNELLLDKGFRRRQQNSEL